MDDATQASAVELATKAEIIREVCQQCREEPGAIWDALEAKGIETTPSVVHQTLNSLDQPAAPELSKASADLSQGLTAEDMAALAIMAVKAGGFEPLIRVLSAWQETARQNEAYSG